MLTLALTVAMLSSCGGTNVPRVIQGFATRVLPAGVPVVGGCKMFPANNWWNTNISKSPLDPLSSQYIAALPGNIQPEFGDNPDQGMPINTVPSTQKEVPIHFDAYGSQSDPGPYPIPPDARIEGGQHANGDRHLLVLQKGSCKLFELWHAYPNGSGGWSAGSGAVFPLNTNKLRPNGWTSADAAGLPITAALVKCAEVKAGVINHALRVAFNETQAGYIHPATHLSGNSKTKSLPPMGLRFRMKASYDLSGITGQSHVIAVAMKQYGMFTADNGSNWEIYGQGGIAASCWNNYDLNQLRNIPNTAFEVVKTGKIRRYPP
jgi:hypothetical protein